MVGKIEWRSRAESIVKTLDPGLRDCVGIQKCSNKSYWTSFASPFFKGGLRGILLLPFYFSASMKSPTPTYCLTTPFNSCFRSRNFSFIPRSHSPWRITASLLKKRGCSPGSMWNWTDSFFNSQGPDLMPLT